MGEMELALAAAQESVDLSQDLSEGAFHSAEAAADLAAALLETGQPERAVELLLGSARGEALVLIAGSPRARFLDVLARSWLALDRHAEARRAAVCADAWASAVQLPMAAVWADRAAAAVDLHAGDPGSAADRALMSAAAADQVGAPVEAALSRMLAGRGLAQTGQNDRASSWRVPSSEPTVQGILEWRAVSSAGRAPALQAGGRRFDPVTAHCKRPWKRGLFSVREIVVWWRNGGLASELAS